MIPGLPPTPGAELGEAFMAAMMSAATNPCECEACRILRNAGQAWRARLAGR